MKERYTECGQTSHICSTGVRQAHYWQAIILVPCSVEAGKNVTRKVTTCQSFHWLIFPHFNVAAICVLHQNKLMFTFSLCSLSFWRLGRVSLAGLCLCELRRPETTSTVVGWVHIKNCWIKSSLLFPCRSVTT